MSRVGKKPIKLPEKTKASYKDRVITIQGEKGTLKRTINANVELEIADGLIEIKVKEKKDRSFQGLTRTIVDNMVVGVSKGFERSLEINGIGYRAEVKGKTLVFNLGYSHPVNFDLPDGISASIDKSVIKLFGIDKELLGHTAASIRQLRPPESYKGKGIKYLEERIQKKAGKTGAS